MSLTDIVIVVRNIHTSAPFYRIAIKSPIVIKRTQLLKEIEIQWARSDFDLIRHVGDT